MNPPQIDIVALLPETRANGGALLLNYRALVRDRLRGSHVADELLHYTVLDQSVAQTRISFSRNVRELILPVTRRPLLTDLEHYNVSTPDPHSDKPRTQQIQKNRLVGVWAVTRLTS